MTSAEKVRQALRELSGADKASVFFAPGRVNLIGEHTDYNDGFVFPMAIDRGTFVAAAARGDRVVRAHSVNLNETIEFDLEQPGPQRRGVWYDYLEGVARALIRRGVPLCGADLVIESEIPTGAGLSSSAAFEISTGLALLNVSDAYLPATELSLAAQEAEHTWVGIKCGIMDQLASSHGRKGFALLIDCRSLEVDPIPLDTSEVAVVVCDTRVKHQLATSAYNERRADCERAVELLSQSLPGIKALRDVSVEQLERYETDLPERIRRRTRHVVTEDARTLTAVAALRAGRIEELGRVMWVSHASLRDDYEVSCSELDALVDIASRVEGVVGARMTGGGFGGCTVTLVRRDALEEFMTTASSQYKEKFGIDLATYVVEASEGAREITED